MSDDETTLARDPDIVVREGAATDSAEAERAISALPRLLRYAHLAIDFSAKERLVAELNELLPEITQAAAAWSEQPEDRGWKTLAADLDGAAARLDRPVLRTLADAIRLISMTIDDVQAYPGEARRVIAALQASLTYAVARNKTIASSWLAGTERMLIGWCALTGSDRERYIAGSLVAHRQAVAIGNHATRHIKQREAEKHDELAEDARRRKAEKAEQHKAANAIAIVAPDDHVLVCPPIDTQGSKSRDACKGHEHAIGKALPLVRMPDIAAVRKQLGFEFPYAEAAIDTLLAPLIGRRFVRLPPTILVGSPGAGKSRLVRRLAECLGVGLWRSDGARADGAGFGGTDRRWWSTEPCHPFLAVSRTRCANPIVLIDEIDKAATRSDYGRLWDAMLGFLEPETARAYPDPCLQVDLDLQHVSYIATANSLTSIPSPLLDRLRVIAMPEPRADDLERLVAPLALDLLAEQQLDARWLETLRENELDLLAAKWKGGSVRRLRAYLAVILRARERGRSLN